MTSGPIAKGQIAKGLRIPRRYTSEGADPYSTIEWARRDSRITNPDGSVVFEVLDAEVPASWSQVATDIVVSKYFRKAGVPQTDAEGNPVLDGDGNPVLGSETSGRQVFDRLATTWRYWGEKHGYFASSEDAQAYEDEMKYMLANQIASPNSPQWFNTGLAHAYGITGTPQGFWYVDPETGEMTESPDSYTHPAPHACFPARARITTREGFKFIEKIEPGDAVLTHEGRYRTVVKTMQRQIDEDLVTLSISRLKGEHFSATANHPVLAVRRSNAKAGSRNPEWIPAGDLNVGDFVIVARPTSSGSIPLPFDLATYAGPNFEITDQHLITRNSGHRPTMSRFVDFNDPGLLRLLGYWLGDGSIGHESRDGELSSVNFVFRGDDLPSQQDVLALMGRHFGVQAPVELAKGQNTAHLRFVRRPLARFFAETFGFGFAGKTLPAFVYDLPRSHRLELLIGLFKSDGYTLTVGNARLMCFDQSNQNLAEGIWRLLRSLGYAPSITGGKVRPGGTVPHFRVTVSVKEATDLAALCGVGVPESPMHDRFHRIGDDVGYRIQGIERVPFYGTVFNFEVEEDESYVANGVVVHNCFINGVSDDLVNPGGIMDLWVREARLFKMGSGTGSNFSQIRAENETLSGGGKSSGVMGFLRIGDRAAGAIKSGGTTRRAAKMVILDLDHPDIEEFIDWKMHEEEKARILINHGGYAADFNGEAYATVSGQNSNNSVRVPNEFIEAVRNDDDWQLRERTSGKVRKTIKARDLWRKVAEAAWACADPGVQFDTIINEWHTSPAGGKIRATNPCFTGDTRIATDKGLIQFKDMVNRVTEGESFQVYTHDATGENPSETISLTTPTQVMITGKNQILRLEFSDGRVLRLTPNHRLWTANRGWVRADELTETDKVRLLDQEIDFEMASMAIPVSREVTSYLPRKSSRKTAVQLPEKWTEDFAHYLGWLIGDGSLTADTAVTVYGGEEEQQSVMWIHRELLTEINGGVAPQPTKMGNGTYQLRLGRHAFMNFLEALGVSRSRATDKRIPWSIFEAPKPIIAAFLKGLYDADGCVRYGDDTRYVGLASASKELLRGAQKLLDTFGVHGTIYENRQGSDHNFEYVTKSGEHRTYKSSPMSDLRIMGSDLTRFHNAIGFMLSIKGDILHQVLVETTRYATKHWVKMRSRTEDGWETTYNLTEPKNHSYLAESVVVSNCSEYVFLDNTACNLASINLVKFFDDDTNVFDTEGYEHAIRLWTITLEISVAMAQFPSREIAQGSYDYRTLGLGYANLGTLLMRMGLPYDSDAGRAVSGAITAILTGYSYATSAELAAAVSPFPRFAENRDAMLRVIRNHRRAAYHAHQNDYEGLSHFVMGINPDVTPSNLLTAARQSWDLALDMGERHGFRNAQVTVIAPTGCLVGGSLVPTERGLVRLQTLGDPRGSQWQDLGIKVGTDEGAKIASQFYINGVEPVVTVDTARGYRIQGTPTHRIKVVQADGSWVWKRFAEIAKEDLVPLQMNQLVGVPMQVQIPGLGTVTPDVAEFMGIAVRYGKVTPDGFQLVAPESAFAAVERFAQLGKSLGLLSGSHSMGTTFSHLTDGEVLSSLPLEAVKAHRIPESILATNDAGIYRAFLDVYVREQSVLDSGLAREIQGLLLAIGEVSTLIPSPDGLEVVIDQRDLSNDGEYVFDRVVSAELGEEQLTYDLSVPENVTYVANGFVSHNTIGLQMDCDTTGVEPDFSLVKFKKLAGGGYFKIVNQSVTPALENLGYTDGQIQDIIRFIVGTSSLVGAPHINRESLMEKGFTEEDMARIEATLPAVFELRHAFNPFVLGEATMQRLGFEIDEYATFEFDLLRSLGFTGREIWEATEWVCGQQTIEGAPHLKDEHLAVFDTANRNGRNGQRLIHHTGHIRMLAATQPFLSGAASKTINMPNEATIEDIEESYMLSYELGVKCMALYRDGSKASQPLSSSSDDAQSEDEPEDVTRAHEMDKQIMWGKIPVGMSPTQAYAQGMHPPRFLLPPRRGGYTQEAKIGGHKVYLRTGEYEDGTLGEVFIDLAKEGATLRGILSCFAIAVSKGLQFGVPLEEFVDTFTFQTFEPRGLVEGHPNIKMANSIVDYVFRALAVEYLKRDDLAQVPPVRDGELPEPASGLAVEAGIQLDLTDAVAEQHVAAVASAVKFLESRPVAPASTPTPVRSMATAVKSKDAGTIAMQSALGEMMGDAPLCDTCGHITIRNGSCYKCLNCGNSLGCS